MRATAVTSSTSRIARVARIARVTAIAMLASLLAGQLTACMSVQSPGLAPIVTDRPDFTDGTDVVGRGLVQVESGATHARSSNERTNSLGEVLIRAGYHEMGELRIELNSYTVSRFGGGNVRGLEDMSIGTKVKLLNGGGPGSRRPAIALLGTTSIPTGARAFRAEKMQPTVKLGVAWELSERVALSSNLNYAWVREAFESWGERAASASLGVALTDRVGSYVEYFAVHPQYLGASKSQYVNGGLAYALTDDLQLDARLGQGVARATRGPDHFFGFGISRRW